MNGIEIAVATLPKLADLELEWRDLELRADVSFFGSWSWIGNWLACLPQAFQPQLLRARRDGQTVGLALLVERQVTRYRVMPVREWHLNATGDAHHDAVMIEYNDVLVDRSVASRARQQMVGLVLGQSALDEFHAHGVQFNAGWATLAAPGFRQLELVRASRGVDLEKVRAEGDYLALISANSRSKIRKTFKDAAQWGALRLEIATDADQARAMYDTLCRLHIEAWNARGKPGAFANPHLLEFHRRLILTRLNHGDIQLATVHAGEQLLGVLYNFVHRGHIYSYQSGFDYLLGAKNFRPGLLVHTMAIEHNAKLGHGYYDFMAGDSQYKRSMGTRSGALHWVVYQRKSLKFQIEYTLRGIKGRLRPPPAAAAPASADQA